VREQVNTGRCKRIALVAQKAAEARDVMVEGESGLLSVCKPWDRAGLPKYEPSKRRLTWPNGAIATTYTAEEPEELRGPQHDGAWADEVAKWKYPNDTWDMLMMGLRLGPNPQCVVTTTPKPTKLVKQLVKDGGGGRVVIARGTTFENLENLSPAFRQIIAQYEGTRLGRQELEGEVLEDVEGALWTLGNIEHYRVRTAPEVLKQVVVGVDPAVTATEDSDETGIIVVGKGTCLCKQDAEGKPLPEDHYFVLADYTVRAAPAQWAARVARAYHDHMAGFVVAEGNNGGDMVRQVIRNSDSSIGVKIVHASRGKLTRAEPVSLLYEQGKVHHVGAFPALEDQMVTWVPGDSSPDRMDALVWAITPILGGGRYA
jgi:phage terminase large subunit-like protein